MRLSQLTRRLSLFPPAGGLDPVGDDMISRLCSTFHNGFVLRLAIFEYGMVQKTFNRRSRR